MRAVTLCVVVGLLVPFRQVTSAVPQAAAAPASTAQATPAATTTVTIADLGFITGSWSLMRGDALVEEQWTAPRGGTLFGVGRTTRGDRTVAFEYLRIEGRRDGIYYVASPGGRPPTAFKLRQFATDRVVFENRAHDFPQRITYWREGQRLCAEAAGTTKGKASAERWCWDPGAP